MKIEHKKYERTLMAVTRLVVQERDEIQTRLEDIAQEIPADLIAGPPFCVFNFITSVKDGYDVMLGIPIYSEIENAQIESKWFPELEVLSLVHRDGPETLSESLGKVFSYAREYAIISDEFYREVYLRKSDIGGPGIEIQFVIHNWNAKLAAGVERVLGVEVVETVLQGSENLEIESGVDARFEWVKAMLARLGGLANGHQTWDIISGCAHVFPQGQIDKLTAVFNESKSRTGDGLQAVDAVLAFMKDDSGWVEGGERDGYTITVAKSPGNRKAYDEAKTDLERRQAYCFCPLVRSKMDQGMPVDFCNCGSGWFRQQWEGATGKPVTIDILQSVLRGDKKCEFAVHLANDI